MKKIYTILTLLLMSAANAGLSAQSFAFYLEESKLNDDAEITVNKVAYEDNYGSDTEPLWYETFESGLSVHNLTQTTIASVGTQHVITAPAYGNLSFCFGNCVQTNADKTLECSISPTNTAALHVSFIVEKKSYTTAKVLYSVYNKFDNTDRCKVTVNYVYQTLDATVFPNTVSKFYTFQTGSELNLLYQFKTNDYRTLNITSLAGCDLGNFVLENTEGKLTIPLTLKGGVYIFTVRNRNHEIVVSSKIVVK